MKLHTNLLALVLLAFPASSFTQEGVRYIDLIFEEVEVVSDVTYAQNNSILTEPSGELDTITLSMDIYLPADDQTGVGRPVVFYLHGDALLPPFLTGK